MLVWRGVGVFDIKARGPKQSPEGQNRRRQVGQQEAWPSFPTKVVKAKQAGAAGQKSNTVSKARAYALPCCRTVPKSKRESDPQHQRQPAAQHPSDSLPPIHLQWEIHCISVGSRDIHVQLLRVSSFYHCPLSAPGSKPPAPSKAPVLPFRHSLKAKTAGDPRDLGTTANLSLAAGVTEYSPYNYFEVPPESSPVISRA